LEMEDSGMDTDFNSKPAQRAFEMDDEGVTAAEEEQEQEQGQEEVEGAADAGAVTDADLETESDADASAADAEDRDQGSDQQTDAFLESAARAAAEAGSQVMEGRRGSDDVPRASKALSERLIYMKNLRMEKLRRRVRTGGMLRRYAPELFNADVYGTDDNDNVLLGSRATMRDAMQGPFAPLPPPRPPASEAAVRVAVAKDDADHKKSDAQNKIRHSDDYNPNDPQANAYTYLPRNHWRKPFGFGKIFARARRDQALDIGPFEQQRYHNQYANPLLAFERGASRVLPLPFNPRLPFAEADAAIQGMRPSKLQQFKDFKPPPKWPSFAPGPSADAKDGGGAAGGEDKKDE